MLLFIFIFWALSAIFSYSFFDLNILPGINPYYILLIVCIIYSFFHLIINKGTLNWWKYGGREFENYFKFFVLWASLFIIISFFNIPKFFNLENLLFDQSYIIRHASFLPSLTIMFCVYLYTFKKISIEKVNRNHLFILLITFLIISLFLWKDGIVYSQLIVMMSSLFFVKKKSLLPFLLLFYFVFIETVGMSSFIFGSVALIIILLYGDNITVFLAEKFDYKLIIICSFTLILLILLNKFIFELINSDANSLWRLNVWGNELRNLVKTYGLGVGYGAAYVDNNIFKEVENSNMYASLEDLFLVANHNSIVNMFYRLGIIGGIGFILMNIALVKWYAKTYVLNTENNKYLLWAFANYCYNFIIIFFNPGLESPRFSYGYLISVGFLIGFIMKSRKFSDDKVTAISNYEVIQLNRSDEIKTFH